MGFFGKRTPEVPKCEFCGQPKVEGHYCEGMKKAEDSLGKELDEKLVKKLGEIENRKGIVYSDDVPEGEGKIYSR